MQVQVQVAVVAITGGRFLCPVRDADSVQVQVQVQVAMPTQHIYA